MSTKSAEQPVSIPFERYELDNGLRVVLSRDPGAPVVAVNLWYNVGSRNERPGRTGFAHLFEHMMFQGSEHVPEMAHFALIEQAGGSLNGSTWLDRTNYFETLPAHYLELGLWLESDRLGWLLPAMTQEKLDNQRDVVKNERRWRVDNQPYGDWDERLQAMMYPPDHPYHHSVIGSMEDLDAASLEDIEQFFRTYYAPNNAVLSIVGDFDPAQARDLVQRYFGDIPSGATVPPIPGRTDIPLAMEGEVRDTVEQDISLARVYQAYRTPPFGSDEYYAGVVASYILGTGKAALLYRTLVRERQLAQDVIAYAFPIVVGASMIVVWATARPGTGIDELEEALTEQIEALAAVDDADVERAVAMLETSHLTELQTVDERADQLSMYATLFDDPDRINTELARVRGVTTADVRAFATRYLHRDNRAVLRYVPKNGADS
ncbi:MAG TPA: pitrilysin family protein [Longimicrobiales bacterium]|nr:pitrilysin family protein [Longimicrobiales bacterium]